MTVAVYSLNVTDSSELLITVDTVSSTNTEDDDAAVANLASLNE